MPKMQVSNFSRHAMIMLSVHWLATFRFDYQRSDYPFQYLCFCGKEENPSSDPWLIAHSCGSKCGRYLRPRCGHQCVLLCHPGQHCRLTSGHYLLISQIHFFSGPCPPCPVMVKASCFCGKTSNAIKRCGVSSWSCERLCGKLLTCGEHVCKVYLFYSPCWF